MNAGHSSSGFIRLSSDPDHPLGSLEDRGMALSPVTMEQKERNSQLNYEEYQETSTQ